MNAATALAKLVIKEIFRKKDFYVALMLAAAILCYASQMRFYDVGNIARYLMEIGLLLVFLLSAILTVALAARQFPSEIQNRTCAVLLAKPVSRWEFVLGKFLGSFLGGAACFGIFFAGFILVVWMRAPGLAWPVAWEVFYLFVLNLLVLAAMASGLSYYLTVSANVTVTLLLYVFINAYGPTLKAASAQWFVLGRGIGLVFYYLLPHFEFFDLRQRFVHRWGPVAWELVALLTVYALAYTVIFLALGWLKWRKQPL